jgi:hypothetical protein
MVEVDNMAGNVVHGVMEEVVRNGLQELFMMKL